MLNKRTVAYEILNPEDVADRIAPHLAVLTHCYGAVVTLLENGHSESKGSMALVKVAAEPYIFTAGHVAKEILAKRGYVFVRPDITEDQAMRGHFTKVVKFELDATDLAWAPRHMDIAAFRAPSGLAGLPYLRWFDAEESSKAARGVRRLANDGHTLPTVIMGCPNFGHFREDSLETLSFLVMYTRISTMGSAWDGISSVPQVHLEVADGSEGKQPPQQGFRSRIVDSLRETAGTDAVPLGGYSGGPLIVIGPEGEFLVGLVTEGDYVFGSARAAAVAWDDIMIAFERRADERYGFGSPAT